MGILAASNSFSSFVVQSQSCKMPYLREHTHTCTHNLKDQREVMKNVGDFGGTLLYIKVEIQKLELKQLQSLKTYWKKK